MKLPVIKLDFALKLTSFMLAISVLPLLLFEVVSYSSTRQAIMQEAVQNNMQLLSNQRDYLNLQMEQIDGLATNLGAVDEINQVLANLGNADQPQSSYDLLATKARIGYVLSGYSNLRGLVSIDLFTLNGTQFHVGDTLDVAHVRKDLRDRLIQSTSSTHNALVWHGVEDNVNAASGSRKVVVATKAINRESSKQTEQIGMLLINFSTDYLHNHFSQINLGEGAYLMIVDARRRLLFHPDKNLIGQPIETKLSTLLQGASGSMQIRLDGRDVLLSYIQIPKKQWVVFSVVPKDTLLAPMISIERIGIAILVFNLLLIVLFMRAYLRQVVSPIRAISEGFKRFQANQLEANWRLEKQNTLSEISDLVAWFNSFLESMEANRQAQISLRIAASAFESQEGMLVTDADGAILQVNQAFTQITGYSAEEVMGKNPRILNSGRQDVHFYEAMWAKINQTGGWEGEIWNRRKSGEAYPEHLTITAVKDPDGHITNYVANMIDITASKASAEEIKNLAFFDPLTRLPNRRLLQDRLQQAFVSSGRSGKEGAILFIDLDNFKTLNDTLGHDIGDLLLEQVAARLTTCVREGDTVARLGGDEFVVMLEDLSENLLEAAEQTEFVGNKILATLNQPYQLGKHLHHSTPSIGASLFIDHTQPIENLLKQADIAMYQAKKAGRNTLRFFDPQMQESINIRAALEGDLRKALEKQEFQLYYQIQVDSTGRKLGAEALIRWLHPERGLVSPADFIPLAEETGLILSIGQWVIQAACARIKSWEQGPLTSGLDLCVNVSAKQFHQADFADQLRSTVKMLAFNPKRLKIEITESMLLENIDATIETMVELKEIGIGFSLDDFGTGYSSLQYLKRLPIDQLKIDQSFVRDIATDSSDKAIVRTIIAMAQSLNLDVIAEGVETEEQRHFLLVAGCTQFQGYLFGKPVPIGEFEASLK